MTTLDLRVTLEYDFSNNRKLNLSSNGVCVCVYPEWFYVYLFDKCNIFELFARVIITYHVKIKPKSRVTTVVVSHSLAHPSLRSSVSAAAPEPEGQRPGRPVQQPYSHLISVGYFEITQSESKKTLANYK